MAKAPKARLLLIDDEEYFVRLVRNVLDKEPVEVVSTPHGREALALLEKGAFDLVVVDHQLPDMEGVEIIEWVQRHSPGLPCIMITGYGTVDVAVRAMKSGAVDFLTKPLEDPNAFARLVRKHLALPAASGARPSARKGRPAAAAAPSEAPRIDPASVRRLCARLDPPLTLTRRQCDVMAALLRGLSNKEIASALFISERTVKNHLTHLYRLFGVESRAQLFNRVLSDLSP